ncbi:ATP-dependent RNA helicase SUPV3L1/SUV3 [Hephaestia caeni]|uniref:ATP-dependent RNA helicase SUPV3L1/SUV3 n=1 Tax=Hephaestia caeni TaxID=645617 RepID=A0A397P6T7_9SPHN|nr:helicase-related protein [Hephaestia caeni]RIA44003.1 ATP-dependent RNA helicase SUPV3L1/SUV3 [Hephaestia caeni]
MARTPSGAITAVLGPTNTGKTHLAIERMCAHSSGMIGFPLRLLAREVYDRVVAIKGAAQVGLITGEEKILPPQARWLLCTAESMPTDREVAFVALDEAQLAADPERGHVFTDRLLHARGRDETMILGSEALRPIVRSLVPEAEIVNRPRFSTLSYAGATKISRLPKRSAIVAFSAEEVYAVAEMLRRLRGGAAVVMGALSPRTRNAQVAMFQAGEVDYLVATDAIGMGLNMDVAHVAFASLRKFDGHRQRRLTVPEMAQIAGRAGRHQRDGSFGSVIAEGPGAFTPEEIAAIEGHHFPKLEAVYWREGSPDVASVAALIDSLEARPDHARLRAAPEALDLTVLKRLAEEDWVRDRARSPAMVARLWAACGVPDFRKVGIEPHARFVARLFAHLSEGTGHIPHDWFAAEIARLDNVQGDVEPLAGRIASARTWAYIAHRADWLADPAHWAERTRSIEERLSDALHTSLTQRFVDKRTTILMRQIGADVSALPVVVDATGEVLVEDHPIGRLDGFRFVVAPDARHADKKLLLAAAEKRLTGERARRGQALADVPDTALALIADPPAIDWNGITVATLAPGTALARPRVMLDRALDCLDRPLADAVRARLEAWVNVQIARRAGVLPRLEALASDAAASPGLRVVAAALTDAGGIAPRMPIADAIEALAPPERKRLRSAGITLGTLDLFDARLLKPAGARWRQALLAARDGTLSAALPPAGATVLPRAEIAGFRTIGAQAVRVDLAERIARAAHDARTGRTPFAPDPALATSMGVTAATFAKLMAQLGFRTAPAKDGTARWAWHGRPRVAPRPRVQPRPDNAFAALADWGRRGG